MVGHRGDPTRHSDNTLAGVMSGLDAVGAVEVDVRLTRDGHLLLSHDPERQGRSVAATDAWDLLSLHPRPGLLEEVVALPGRIDFEVKNLPGEEGFDAHGRMALLVGSRAGPADLLTSFYWPDMDLARSRRVPCPTGLVVGERGSLEDALAHAVENGHRCVSAHDSLLTPDA